MKKIPTIIDYHFKIQSDDVIEASLADREKIYGELNRESLQLAQAYAKANEHGVLDYLGEEARNAFQALGKHLFNLLFQGDIKTQFDREIVERLGTNQDLNIRFRLNFQLEVSPEIIGLPWEFLYYSEKDIFLATHPKIAFSYQYNNLVEGYDRDSNGNNNTRILFVHYHPKDLQGIGDIKVRNNIKLLTEHDHVNFQEDSNLSLAKLEKKIAEYQPHIFHFLTHGRNDEFKGEFALINQENKAFWCDDQSFSYLFQSWLPKLVILQSCESGKIPDETSTESSFPKFSGGASWLIRKNIPAVIAWRYPLKQGDGWIFLEEFYQSLTNGNPIDQAVQEGRLKLAIADNSLPYSSHSFGSPILWNNLQESELFIITNVEQRWQELIAEIEKEIYINLKDKQTINALKIAELIGDDEDNDYYRITQLVGVEKEVLEENPCDDKFQDRLSIIYHNYKIALELYKNEEQPTYEVKRLLDMPVGSRTLFKKGNLPEGINVRKSVFEYLNNLDLFEKIIKSAFNNIE